MILLCLFSRMWRTNCFEKRLLGRTKCNILKVKWYGLKRKKNRSDHSVYSVIKMYFSLPTKGNIHLILNLLINEINFTVRAKICFSLIVLCLYSVAHRKEACHPKLHSQCQHLIQLLYCIYFLRNIGAEPSRHTNTA